MATASAQPGSDAEQRARHWWGEAGQTLRPETVEGRSGLIVATDRLAEAVAEELAQWEIDAKVDQVRVDPRAETPAEVIAVATTFRGRAAVVPVFPTAIEWRVYARPEPKQPLVELLATVTAPVEFADRGGWVPAAVVARHLAAHFLESPATAGA